MPDKTTSSDRLQILGIDVLRFVAAMLVVAYHFGGLGVRDIDPRLAGHLDQSRLPDFGWLTDCGWVGVEIFFVISGYVIAISAENSNTSNFLRRRFLRLAPAAWICGTLTLSSLLLATQVNVASTLTEWLVSVTLWPLGKTIDPSYWTIGIEVSFYAIVATQLRGPDNKRSLNRLSLIIGVIGIAFAILVRCRLTPAQPDYLWQLMLVMHGAFFALGMMISAMHARGWSSGRAIFCAALTIAGVMEIQSHNLGRAFTLSGQLTPEVLIFLAALIFLIAAPRFQSLLSGAGTKPVVMLLGKITYPLYLIHQTAGSILIGILLTLGVGGGWALALATFAAIGTAMLIAAYIEPAVRTHAARSLFNHAPRQDIPPTASPSIG